MAENSDEHRGKRALETSKYLRDNLQTYLRLILSILWL